MPEKNNKSNGPEAFYAGNGRSQQASGKQNKRRGKRLDYRDIYQNPYTQKNNRQSPRMDVRGQTPAKRRRAKEQKRINPNQTEIRYGARTRQDYRIKNSKSGNKDRRKNRRLFLVRIGLFAVIFFSMAFFACLAFFISLTGTSDEVPGRLWISVGLQNVEKTDDTRADGAKYFRDGSMYVDMTFLSETYDMITTGDRDRLKFIFNKNGEYATFCAGTSVVYVNGNAVILDSKTISENGRLYVPAEFFNRYVNELEISFTDDNNVNVINIIQDSERNESGRYVGKMLTLSLKKDTGHTNIPEDSLSDEIKASTYFMTYVPDGKTDAP